VGRPFGGQPPERGEAKAKSFTTAAASGQHANTLASWPFSLCTGKGPGLGIEGERREDVLVRVCVDRQRGKWDAEASRDVRQLGGSVYGYLFISTPRSPCNTVQYRMSQ
jgi:hypothetical protein